MKFDTKVHYKEDKHCEYWLLGVRLTPLAATFSIFMKKEYCPKSFNTYNLELMAWFIKLSVVMQ